MPDIIITENHKNEALSALRLAKERALKIIGLKGETYAKGICPVGTEETTGIKGYRGGTLRNSITHQIEGDMVSIGSNVEYAPYVELGTGPNFKPPPDWEQFDVPPPKGIGHGYVRARPYLRPAVEEHLDEYKDIIKEELKDA